MTTALMLGPADHGRPITREEFDGASYQGGYWYELIDGRLYVSPAPNPDHDLVLHCLLDQLSAYARRRSDVINHVTPNARIFLPGRPDETEPHPDMAAYCDFPRGRRRGTTWRQFSPVLVAEVVS